MLARVGVEVPRVRLATHGGGLQRTVAAEKRGIRTASSAVPDGNEVLPVRSAIAIELVDR